MNQKTMKFFLIYLDNLHFTIHTIEEKSVVAFVLGFSKNNYFALFTEF